MEVLESLVQQTLTDHETAAPDAIGLLDAVRGGVGRRRRMRLGASVAAIATAAVMIAVVLAVPAMRGRAPAASEWSLRMAAPADVLAAADEMSRSLGPHPPATVIWVATSFNAWFELSGDTIRAEGLAYVVELRGTTEMTCVACHPPTLTGRYSYEAIARPVNNIDASLLSNVDFPLSRLGTVHVLGTDF